MRRRLKIFFPLVITLLFLPQCLRAEERTVTLEEAYAIAVGAHESVRIAGETVAQAEAGLTKATSRILPNVTAEGAYTKYSEAKTSGTVSVQPDEASRLDLRVTQPLYSGGREWAVRRQARLNIEKSRVGVAGTKEDVMASTASAYYSVLKAQKDLEIKKAALTRAGERRKVAEARFRVGEATKAEVLRAEAEVAGAEAELTTATSALADSRVTLKRVLGTSEDINVAEPAAQAPLEEGVEALIEKAYQSRRDYKRSVYDERMASEDITYARGAFLPSLKLEGLYSHKEQTPQTTFFVENSTSASVILTYPIFEGWLRKAELSEARSKYRASELRRLSLKRDIEVEVRDAYNDVASSKAVIESYRRQVSFAEENYRMVFGQYRHGLATTVDVIDADTTLISAQRSYVNALYDHELALITLKYKTGMLLVEAAK